MGVLLRALVCHERIEIGPDGFGDPPRAGRIGMHPVPPVEVGVQRDPLQQKRHERHVESLREAGEMP